MDTHMFAFQVANKVGLHPICVQASYGAVGRLDIRTEAGYEDGPPGTCATNACGKKVGAERVARS